MTLRLIWGDVRRYGIAPQASMGLNSARSLAVQLGIAVSLLLGAAGSTAVSADASSHGRWTEPEVVLEPPNRVHGVTIAAGPSRYAVLSWISGAPRSGPAADPTAGRRVFASVRRPAARTFGAPIPLSLGAARDVQLGVADDGDTVLMWTEDDGAGGGRVMARFRGAVGDWSEPQTVAELNTGAAATLAVAADGSAVATWRAGGSPAEGHAQAALRAAWGSFEPPQELPIHPAPGTGPIPTAGPGGRAMVLWGGSCPTFDPDGREDARASVLSEGRQWGHWEVIPDTQCPPSDLEAVIDDSGTAVLVTGSQPPLSSTLAVVKAAVRAPGDPFSPAGLISPPGREADFPRVAIDGAGTATAVFQVFRRSEPRGIVATERAGNGSFRSPRRISGPRASGIHRLAVATSGHAVALWQRSQASPRRNLLASFKRPGRWFGDAEAVSPRMPKDVLAIPDVAISTAGDALASWGRPHDRTATNRGVFVAKRAPNCRGVEATAVADRTSRVLRGTSGRRDVLVARGGRYRINARGGKNLICAGAGADRIRTGAGGGRVHAGKGADRIRVGRGDHRIFVGPGRDTVIARAPGRNRIHASKGKNLIRCGPGVDVVIANRQSRVAGSCDRVVRR